MMFTSRLVLQFLCITATATGFFVTEEEVIKGMDPNCPTVKHYTAVYHQDAACDRAQQNLFKESLDRVGIQRRLHLSGTDGVPSEQTSYCPLTVNPLTSPETTMGFDTVWLVENTASTPVVVAFMLAQADGSFREVSAFDNKISPPNHDPKAILQPGQWKSLQTYEGHVFHVREILKDGGMGQVLLQHRVGLYPVTNKYGHELHCNPNDPDPEPLAEVVGAPGQLKRDPNFAREAPRVMRPCNVIDIGFRNEVGCPLNAYYTGMYQLKGAVKPRGNLRIKNETDTTTDSGNLHTPKSCHEIFKFHLGLQERTNNNFMLDWNSKTKYEGTYVGHNFVFRYAKDERIVVDSVALHPTRVIDCPGLKNQVNAASVAEGVAIMAPVMLRNGQDEEITSQGYVLPHLNTMMMVKNLNMNATTSNMMMMMNSTEWAAQQMMPSPSQQRRRRASGSRTANVLTQSL